MVTKYVAFIVPFFHHSKGINHSFEEEFLLTDSFTDADKSYFQNILS